VCLVVGWIAHWREMHLLTTEVSKWSVLVVTITGSVGAGDLLTGLGVLFVAPAIWLVMTCGALGWGGRDSVGGFSFPAFTA
ncbi:hypothetical protein, partial [Rhodopirellula sp. MGV]|uniref:hypothetical protein n=1 Tax=Rhodopirellula sp. MGV TaxID=2023130 RepID=UPI001E30146E